MRGKKLDNTYHHSTWDALKEKTEEILDDVENLTEKIDKLMVEEISEFFEGANE